MPVPLVDLKAQHAAIRSEIDDAIQGVIESASFVGGPRVAAFEAAFASFCRAPHAVGVGNGTDALVLALKTCGVSGGEVVTAPNSFVATAEAITLAGATPVFADVDPDTLTLSPERLEEALTERTRAIVPVHLYGQTADMDPILRIARSRGLAVIEDACQAHGAEYHGRRAGTLGDAAAFSFYPGKNLGACGDAGAVVTADAALAARVRMVRNHGRTGKYDHAVEGINSRLDAIQAAILSAKLPHLERWNAARRELAALYREALADVDGIAPTVEAPGRRHVYHLFVVRTVRRDELLASLRSRGIDAGVHYPIPLHRLEAYRRLDLPIGSFPVAEAASREVLSLPMFPEMTHDQVLGVCGAVREFSARAAA
ncbi:MAG TPA: DegT/DnrJ/EryC1/StrS family aminotransferase [Candidatus Polarisedimenticolia bacterium]|jgi:dTDP-4-amino-4,6-dideoxygalactose transaminase